ncbi:MAG: M20/M25/M40 family metallo-hydrolase, partial [Acutalibacteraceae bacterium]
MTLFTKRKAFITEIVDFLNKKYGEGTITLTLSDSYYNMKEKIEPHFRLVENAEKAMRKLGVEPVVVPIRGGTDGAMLSYKGLPCPNLCTGGANFHSVHEFVCVESMEIITDLVVELAK